MQTWWSWAETYTEVEGIPGNQMMQIMDKQELTIKLWKVVHQVRVHDLLLQQVLLVQEQDD